MVEEKLRKRVETLEAEIEALTRDHRQATGAGEGSAPSAVVTSEATDTGRTLQHVLLELRKDVPFDSASIQELRDGRLIIVGGVGFADLDVILGESFDVDNADSPNGEVVHRGRPFIVSDTEQYRAFRRGLHVGANIRSWLGAPLLHQDQLLGIIALDKAEADFYTAEHQRVIQAFAPLAAAVIAERRR